MGIPIPVTPELDERTATAAAQRAARVFKDAGEKAGAQFAEAAAVSMKVPDGELKKSADKAVDAYDKVSDALGRVNEAQTKLDQAQRNGNQAQIISRAEALERAQRAQARALRDATDAYRDYENAADNAGKGFLNGLRGAAGGAGQSGGDMANEFVHGFAGSSMLLRLGAATGPIGLALAGVATLGVGAGKLLASGISEGLATLQVQDLYRARLGVDEATMQRYGEAAAKAYASGWGDSIADNLGVTQFGVQTGLINSNASEADVQQLIQRSHVVAATIGEDVESVTKGTRNFIKTGLVDSYQEGFDLIIAASQKGLNVSHDLLDSAEEYGVAFKAVGLSGADALGLIKQMSDAGIRNTDVAADSLKELAINAADGSESTKKAFRAMGLDADDMTRRIAEGGPAARAAFGAIMDGLAAIQDPTERNNVGLALYKTKWEDARVAIEGAHLDTAAEQLGKINGKTKDATETLKAHVNEWDNLGRKIDTTFTKWKQWLADSEIGRFLSQGLPKDISDNLFGTPDPSKNALGRSRAGGVLPPGAPADPGTLPQIDWQPGLSPRQQSDLTDRPHDFGTGDGGPLTAPRVPFDPNDPKKVKPSFDPSQYSLDAIPIGGFPGINGAPGVPGAPGSGQQVRNGQVQWGTGGDPYGKPGYGYYQVDPNRVYDAESSVLSAKSSVEQARIRVLELEADNTTTAQDLAAAKNSVAMTERGYLSAQTKLAEAQQGTWKKLENTAKDFTSSMDQLGASLDSDFGISKGLAGIADNLTKFIANLAAAPLLGQLSAVSQANPSKGGFGLLGMLGAQGAFGPRFTSIDPTQQGYGYAPSAMGPAGLRSGTGSDAALLAAIPAGRYSQTGNADLVKGLGDCSSAVEDLVNIMDGRPTGGRSMATGNAAEWLTSRGFMPGMGGPGDFRVGYNSGHMQATLPGGTNFNWGSDASAAQRGLDGGMGAYDPSFTSHYYRPAGNAVAAPGGLSPQQWNNIAQAEASGNWQINSGNGYSGGLQFNPNTWTAFGGGQYAPQAWQASPEQQMAVGNNVLAAQGPGAWPATSAAHPEWFNPAPLPNLPKGFGGEGYPGSLNNPGPSVGGAAGSRIGASVAPAAGYGPGGVGIAPGGTLDTAMGVAAAGLDMLAPGAGQAAQTGIKLANRAIQFGGQAAAIGVQGLMETFLPTGGSDLANKNWITRIAGGIAGAAPALPNVAGKAAAPPNPNQADPYSGQSGSGGPMTQNITVNNQRATEDGTGRDIAYHTGQANGQSWFGGSR